MTSTCIGSSSPTPSAPSDAEPSWRPWECERIAALPKDHKVILVPTGPSYSPIGEELWPLVNHTVQQCLLPHPELRATINPAVLEATAEHRGWRNPFPADLAYSPKPKSPIRAK